MMSDCISQLEGGKQALKGRFYVIYVTLIICILGILK